MAFVLNKINSFSENLAEGKINLGGTGITLAFTNTAHTATWDELADLTLCTGHANTSTKVLTISTSSQTSGTYALIADTLEITASGDCGPFRYVYLYDDASTGDKLIAYYDYGSTITLASGNIFKWSDPSGILTLA